MATKVEIANDTSLNDACEEIAGNLPEDYHIEIYLENGCGCVELYHNQFDKLDFPFEIGDTIAEQLAEAVRAAEEHHG